MPKKLRIVVSLTTNDNDYQIEQAQSAEQAASRLGVSVEIIYADNDAINQSTQILKVVQAAPEIAAGRSGVRTRWRHRVAASCTRRCQLRESDGRC